MNLALTLAVALIFAALHVASPRLGLLDVVPRSRWLSFAGGVSVAYVFVHILPEMAERQAELGDRAALLRQETELFLVALGGLVAFYGLERLAKTSARASQQGGREISERRVFWLHVGAFAVYNGLIGYLLVHREEESRWGLFFYAVALGLHFVVSDRGLQEHHGHHFPSLGRWVLAGAVLAGWALGVAMPIDEAWLSALFAFLAGGIVLNVLKEELPEERESRFSAFVIGTVFYAALLQIAS